MICLSETNIIQSILPEAYYKYSPTSWCRYLWAPLDDINNVCRKLAPEQLVDIKYVGLRVVPIPYSLIEKTWILSWTELEYL